MKLLDYLYEELREWPSRWVWVILIYVLFNFVFDALGGLIIVIGWLS